MVTGVTAPVCSHWAAAATATWEGGEGSVGREMGEKESGVDSGRVEQKGRRASDRAGGGENGEGWGFHPI
jgi:hypothetical protein